MNLILKVINFIFNLQLNLRNTSFLLEKLILRDNLNTLILNLYPGNKGYSLAFRNQSNDIIETSSTSSNRNVSKHKLLR